MDRFGDEGGTMTDPKTTTVAEASLPDADPALEPSPEEINAWAERERARRQAWLAGPSEQEREDYAAHLRQRRLAEAFDEGEARIASSRRVSNAGRYVRLCFSRWRRSSRASSRKNRPRRGNTPAS